MARSVRTRPRSSVRPFVAVVVAAVATGACSSDSVEDRAVRELAVGRWACAADAEGAERYGFEVDIDDDGTFDLAIELASAGAGAARVDDEIAGTWTTEGGDLRWGFDDPAASVKAVVEGFDDLTLDSTTFTLRSVLLEPNDGSDDPPDEEEIFVDTHGTDSVTFRAARGEPWTCDRQ